MSLGKDYKLRDASAEPVRPLRTSGRWKENADDRGNPAMWMALVLGIGIPLAFVLYFVVGLLLGW